MNNDLHWGLLSTAGISREVIPPLKKSPRNRLVAVASRELAKSKAFAAKWEIEEAFGSYEELLADPDIDIIYNPLPNALHAEWTIKALEAGKHVLCEKPLATTTQEVEAIIAAVKRTGKIVEEGFMYRHSPQTLKVKELIDSGKIGKVVMMHGMFSFYLANEQDIRMDAALGGGSIWDLGCYPISYFRYLSGMEPDRVFGYKVDGNTGVDVTFSGEMRFPGNALAQFQCSFRSSPSRQGVEVLGEEGQIIISNPFRPGPKEEIRVMKDTGMEKIEVDCGDLYAGEVENIADAVLNQKPPLVTLDDSLNNTRVIINLLESARSGKVI
jgi:predicted dehydrogenase